MPRYFAYGSALHAGHVADWARDHGHPPDFLEREGAPLPAALDDHALAFTVTSRYWGGQVGTLTPQSESTVYGTLFELDADAMEIVRHKEGARTGLYREILVEVRIVTPGDAGATLQLLDAATFVAASPGPAGPPSARWLDTVIEGARARQLPAEWLAALERQRQP